MINRPFFIPIILLALLVFGVIIFISTGRTSYYNNEKAKFSFRNRFPFELYYQRLQNIVSYFRFSLIYLFMILMAIPIFFVTSFSGGSNIAFVCVITIFCLVADISGLALFFVKPYYFKSFKIYVTIFFAILIMINLMIGILCLSGLFTHFAYKIIAGVAFILAAVNIILAINPKLRNWDKMDVNKNFDGTVEYVRPKLMILPLSEWINYLVLILSNVLLLTITLLVSLGL